MDAKKMIEQIDLVIQQLVAMQSAIKLSLPTVAPSIEAEAKAAICHYCKLPLNGEKPNRGDHGKCYKEIIALGVVTEETAIEQGWFAPAQKAGRKPKESPLTRYAAEKLAKNAMDEILSREKSTKTKKVADKKSDYRKDS
jgi:hypothetical protein